MFGNWCRTGLLLLLIIKLDGKRNRPLPHTNHMDLSLSTQPCVLHTLHRVIRKQRPEKHTSTALILCLSGEFQHSTFTIWDGTDTTSKHLPNSSIDLTSGICRSYWMLTRHPAPSCCRPPDIQSTSQSERPNRLDEPQNEHLA